MREFEHGGECDQGVDISDTEGGGLAKDVLKSETSRQERIEDGYKAEVEQPTEQGQRPVCMRKPSNCYGKWILNGLQQMLDHLKDKPRKYKELMKTLKP